MSGWRNPYTRRFVIGMVGYTITLPVTVLLLAAGRIEGTVLAVAVALLPVLPFAYGMWGVIGNVRSQDEFQQRVHLEAVLVTALLTGAVTFSIGLLEAADLIGNFPMIWVAPFMIITWGVANALIQRRYQ